MSLEAERVILAMMVIFRKVTITILVAAFFAFVGYLIYLDIYYAYYMPRSPDPVTGRVYSVTVNHGFVVYVTQQERARLFFSRKLMPIVCGLTLFAAAILQTSLRRKREGGPPNRA
jgi:hypothetical protein